MSKSNTFTNHYVYQLGGWAYTVPEDDIDMDQPIKLSYVLKNEGADLSIPYHLEVKDKLMIYKFFLPDVKREDVKIQVIDKTLFSITINDKKEEMEESKGSYVPSKNIVSPPEKNFKYTSYKRTTANYFTMDPKVVDVYSKPHVIWNEVGVLSVILELRDKDDTQQRSVDIIEIK